MLNLQCDLQLVIIAGTLWMIAKHLGTEVEGYCTAINTEQLDYKGVPKRSWTWQEIRLKYDSTRTLASLINQEFGWSVGYYLAAHILFNSITIDEIFLPEAFPNLWQSMVLFTYTGILDLCMLIFLCVDICRQVY